MVWSQSIYSERDSIEDAQIMQAFFYKTKFQVTLGHENTLITQGTRIRLNSLKVGLQMKQKYKFGLYFGFSRTYNTYKPENIEVAHYETNITGFGGYFEYVFIENYRWYMGIPFTLGNARVYGEAVDANGHNLPKYDWESERIGVYSLGLNGGYNINYWLTLTAGCGYRLTSNADHDTRQTLNTLFYNYGIKFKLGHFFTSVIHPKRVRKMKSIYFRNKETWPAKRFKSKYPEYFK